MHSIDIENTNVDSRSRRCSLLAGCEPTKQPWRLQWPTPTEMQRIHENLRISRVKGLRQCTRQIIRFGMVDEVSAPKDGTEEKAPHDRRRHGRFVSPLVRCGWLLTRERNETKRPLKKRNQVMWRWRIIHVSKLGGWMDIQTDICVLCCVDVIHQSPSILQRVVVGTAILFCKWMWKITQSKGLRQSKFMLCFWSSQISMEKNGWDHQANIHSWTVWGKLVNVSNSMWVYW